MTISTRKENFLILVLILIYTIGIFGSTLPYFSSWFLSLSPYNLSVTFLVLIFAKKTSKILFTIFLLIAFLIGISIELIGVHSGLLFGQYSYGENLGMKIYEVPFVIGLNWGIVAVASNSILAYIKMSRGLKIISAAVIMTLLDLLIEPISSKINFWHWENDTIPIYNFICWFIFGVIIQLIFYALKLEEKNKVFVVLLTLLIVFFTVLNVYYT